MSEQYESQIRSKLENILAELVEANSSAKLNSATVDLDQARVGRLSRMDALQNQAISQSALGMRKQQIVQAKSALQRLEAGNYGYCTECEEAIDPRRLNHNPAVAMCVKCAEKAER